jgi:uncharacterized membrane protein
MNIERKTKILEWIISVLIILFLSRFFTDFLNSKEEYNRVLLIIFIMTLFYSTYTFFLISEINSNIETISQLIFLNISEFTQKYILLTFFILTGSYLFQDNGKWIAIFGIIIILVYCIIGITVSLLKRKNWSLEGALFNTFIIGWVYLLSFSPIFKSEFGYKEIGHYFEKDEYSKVYPAKVRCQDSNSEIAAKVKIYVSKKFNVYDTYSIGTNEGAYSLENFESDEMRYVRVDEVYIGNETYIMSKCIIQLEENIDNLCLNDFGEECQINIIYK